MARRYFSSVASATTLTSGISSGATSIVVGSVSGFPGSYPYTLILDPDTASEEVVSVTAGASTTLTVARGVDGTAASAHDAAAVVKHGVSARDFDEPNAHIAASAAVHGLAGTVVGTTDTQTLTNKTLTSPALNTPTVNSRTLGGAWTAYTPTFNNWTVGTGATQTGRYTYLGDKTVVFHASVVLGTGFGTSGSLRFTLPVAPNTAYNMGDLNVRFLDSSSGLMIPGRAIFGSGTYVTLYYLFADQYNTVMASSPFTFAAGDSITVWGVYEAS